MGVQVCWDDDAKTILYCEFEYRWSWTEFHSAVNKMVFMAKQVNHQVSMIADMKNSPPLTMDAFDHGKRALQVMPANITTILLTNGDTTARNMAVVLNTMTPNQTIQLVNTPEEARALLPQQPV